MKGDIRTHQDVQHLVTTFYDTLLKDSLLQSFFIHLNLDEHLPHVVHFWAFVLLDEPGYTTSVTEKHARLRLQQQHLDQWLLLFNQTIDELFLGEKAEIAKQRAAVIGWTIGSKTIKK